MSSADLQEASKAKKAKSDSNNDELVKLLLGKPNREFRKVRLKTIPIFD